MSDSSWLASQLDRARKEVESWSEWKRDAMRREASSVGAGRAPLHPDPKEAQSEAEPYQRGEATDAR